MAALALNLGLLPPRKSRAATPSPKARKLKLVPVPPLRDEEKQLDPAIDTNLSADASEAVPANLDREAARRWTQRALKLSLAFFASEVIKGNVSSRGDEDAPALGQTVIADHHLEWETIVRTQKRFCLIAPRDHGKSHFFTIALPIWEGWRRPGCIIALFSETQPQAEEQLAKLKREVESNPRLSHLMDPSCWSATKIRFTNGSLIYAKGFGVKSRGMHPHLIICDDVVSEVAMYSALIRERQANFFYGALRNMLVPGGQLAVIGTPQHDEDLYGLLAVNKKWFFKRYAAIDTDRKSPTFGRILFPERYSKELLDERKDEIGEIRFAREFLGRPMASGMSLFPDDLVRGEPFFDPMATLGPLMSDGTSARAWWMAKGVTRFFAGVDIARGTSTKADYFVIFVLGLNDRGVRYVVDIYRERGLDYNVQKSKIAEKSKFWQTELTCIEANNAQDIYGEELRLDTDIPIHLHKTGVEKHSLEKGIPSLRLLFENRKYRCPRGNDDTIIATDIWLGELQSWTFTKDKGVISVGKHDDTAMAQWLCEIAIGRGEAFSFAFSEQPGDAEAEAALIAEEEAIGAAGLEDPWILMGLEPEDMQARQGQRGNLDFGGQPGAHQGVPKPLPQLKPGERPRHPLGGKPPMWNIFRGIMSS